MVFVIHPVCGALASGVRAAHCVTCHDTFGGVHAFDEHRVGGECVDPATKGYVKVDRNGWTRWVEPMDDASQMRLNEL